MKKILSGLLAVVLLVSMFTGCGEKKEGANSTVSDTSSSSAGGNTYPLKGNPKLKVWAGSVATRVVPTNADTIWAPELEKRTGVKIEWLHSMSNDQFNLMIASGDLPDIIYNDWIYGFTGGPSKAMADGIIIPLNDAFTKYSPNISKFIKDNPDVGKRMRTDDGKYSVYPTIRNDDDLRIYYGPIVRKDWMEELSISTPETIDDWYTMLKAFKEKKNLPAPLSFEKGIPPRNGGFIGSYGLYFGMFMDNGKVKFGPAEPAYKDFLTTFAKWYKEGLIDPDVATVDTKVLDSKVTSGKTGAAVALVGGGMGTWLTAMKGRDPKFDLVGVPYPVLKKGEKPKLSPKSGVFGPYQAAISTQCKNVEAAAKWLDYNYSEEGKLFNNFGIEGTSYTMVNGFPTYTDAIMKAPEGARNIMGKYLPANANKIDDVRAFQQYSISMPQQQAAVKAWVTDADKYLLPEIQPTSAEIDELSTLMTDINAYVNEMYFKFLFGQEPIEKFDSYIAQLKKLGVEKAIKLNQNALDRYQKR